MPLSKIDRFYRSILMSKYFIKGWGNPADLKRLLDFRKVVANRDTCFKLVPSEYEVQITKQYQHGNYYVEEGSFLSPFEIYMPGLLPEESKYANFQVILPKAWSSNHYKPVCLHMAGTGDHYFWRRRHIIAKPLLKEAGIGSILLENPFYGTRKPKDQVSSILRNVSDIFVMGGCLILESLVIFHWCLRQGFGPLGVTGLSMGGHMASLAATNWPYPIVLVPCLSWSTASSVFTEGVMSSAINWTMLEDQYTTEKEYKDVMQSLVSIIGNDAYFAGQQFAKDFPTSMEHFVENINMAQTVELDKHYGVVKSSASGDNRNLSPFFGKPLISFNITEILKSTLLSTTLSKDVKQKFASEVRKDQTALKHYETLHFMKGIMDECTHLRNFSVPVDTSLIISVCAKDDGYVPREGVTDLVDIWPGAEVKYIDGGHVTAFILYQKMFRSAIIECFERYKKKYLHDKC